MKGDFDPQKSRPISGARLRTAGEIEKSYDSMTYKKSGAVFRMFANFPGKIKFYWGFFSFIHSHAYKLVDAKSCLKMLLDSASNRNEVRTMAHQWSQQAGYPIIFVYLIKGASFS